MAPSQSGATLLWPRLEERACFDKEKCSRGCSVSPLEAMECIDEDQLQDWSTTFRPPLGVLRLNDGFIYFGVY